MHKALPQDLIEKYEERDQEENLNLAAIEGFVR